MIAQNNIETLPSANLIEIITTTDIHTARRIVHQLRKKGKRAGTEMLGPIQDVMSWRANVNVIVKY